MTFVHGGIEGGASLRRRAGLRLADGISRAVLSCKSASASPSRATWTPMHVDG